MNIMNQLQILKTCLPTVLRHQYLSSPQTNHHIGAEDITIIDWSEEMCEIFKIEQCFQSFKIFYWDAWEHCHKYLRQQAVIKVRAQHVCDTSQWIWMEQWYIEYVLNPKASKIVFFNGNDNMCFRSYSLKSNY